MICTLCKKTQPYDGLCPTCTLDTLDHITAMPHLWAELEDWLVPGVRGGAQYGGRVRMAEAPLPLDEEALTLRAAGGIAGVLEDWHDAIREARHQPIPPRAGSLAHRVGAASAGVAGHIHFIAQWEQGAQLAREIRQLVARIRRVTEPGHELDEPKPPLLLGYCVAVDPSGVVCGSRIYADIRRAVQCGWCLALYPPDRWLELRRLQPGNQAAADGLQPAAA
ncbi:hypothetical protein PV569_13080 [Streptomyces scabiei]|uniref:hypothetical protein n=1 Tax=Streptomyces scabiei TaxID=1930 RepID=UPI0029BE7D40|nr:hypothetical protein [Streptomyces scabiei]MDX3294640.1 hypothetical protein [Streptomyces scabiei]